jgi:hypothetical protein
MKLGAALFLHSLMMVVRNFIPAIRIFLGPGLIIAALLFAFAHGMDNAGLGAVDSVPDGEALGGIGLNLLLVFGLIAVCLSILIWATVAWHRFVLLEESLGFFLPKLRLANVGRYFLGSFKLTGVLFLIALPVLVVLLGFAQVLDPRGLVLFELLGRAFLAVVLMRFAIILPAAALNQSITLGEAFEATKGHSFSLLVLVICGFGLQSSAEYLIDLLAEDTSLYQIGMMVFSFFFCVFQISILTTLYGHFVEGRPVT